MIHVLRAIWDGFLLRCPRCHRGRMFDSSFTMRTTCPACGLPFERSSGEMTGGMAINTVATLFLVIVAALGFGLSPSIPLLPLLAALTLFAIIFPIAFYRQSRGLWASILYLTGDNNEPD